MADHNTIKEQYDSLLKSVDLSDLTQELDSVSTALSSDLQDRLDAVSDRGYKFINAEKEQLQRLKQFWDDKASDIESIIHEDVPELQKQVQQLQKRAESVLKKAQELELSPDSADEDEEPKSSRRLSMSSKDEDQDDDKPSSGRRLSMSRDDDEDEDQPASSRRLSLSREDDDDESSSGRRLSLSDEKDDEKDNESKIDAELTQLEGIINKLQEKSDQIRSQLADVESKVSDEILALTTRLSRIEWMLDQLEEAGFEMQPGENIYLLDKAEWTEEGKRDDPDGVMYLTTQRVIFEQKEKVGKRLGMFGGKKVQDVLWEFPVTAISELNIENKGMLGGKDVIHFRLNDQSRYADISVIVKGSGDNKEWAESIEIVKSGDLL